MNYKVLVAAFLAASVVSAAGGGFQEPPLRWAKLNGVTVDGTECAMGVDGDMRAAGQRNLSLKCDADTKTFAGLRQAFNATPYRGERIRFSAWIKSAGVAGEADGAGAGVFIALSETEGDEFGHLSDTPVAGWTDWEYREVAIDVPDNGQWLNIGFWMRGHGQAWLRDPAFEVLPESVSTSEGDQPQ
jgi:hypothetical protein